MSKMLDTEEMKTMMKSTTRTAVVISVLILLLADLSSVALAGVSASYRQEDGKTAVVEINVSPPAPRNLIVQVYLPSSTVIAATEPPAAKFERDSGTVKWLLKNISSGNLQLRVRTGGPYPFDQSSASVRFRKPGTNSVFEVPAEK